MGGSKENVPNVHTFMKRRTEIGIQIHVQNFEMVTTVASRLSELSVRSVGTKRRNMKASISTPGIKRPRENVVK